MPDGDQKSKTRRVNWSVVLPLTSALLLISWIVVQFLLFRSARREFLEKPSTVTDVISSVQQYRLKHGTYPDTLGAVVAPARAKILSDEGWTYHRAPPPDDGAQLQTGGPLHMQLFYIFGSQTDSEQGWFYSQEGSLAVPLSR